MIKRRGYEQDFPGRTRAGRNADAADLSSFDIQRTRLQCFNHALNRGPQAAVARCQELIDAYTP